MYVMNLCTSVNGGDCDLALKKIIIMTGLVTCCVHTIVVYLLGRNPTCI